MRSARLARFFFALVATVGIAAILSGTACTRWGRPGPVPPTVAPLSTIYVDPINGSNTSGNGSSAKPFATLTKAVAVLASAKVISTSGVTIHLASGAYTAARGEVFPIVIPRTVTIDGSNFGTGPRSGSFIDGFGEDTLFEQIVHAPQHSAYATLEVVPGASVGIGDLYLGASKISLPSRAGYASLDALGTVNASLCAFGSGILSRLRNLSGILVAGGSLTCSSCEVHGNDFGIGALTVPLPTASPSSSGPSVTLNPGSADSTIAAKVVDIVTDGSVNVTASGEHFELAQYAFADSLRPLVQTAVRGAIDFGGGAAGSPGGNIFIGARRSEILIVRRFETVSALDDTWNPSQQRANRNGQYPHNITFASGATGKNVTIRRSAAGSTVSVGPAPVPTPSTTPSPTASPT